MSWLSPYIKSRLGNYPDNYTQEQWSRSREATAWFDDRDNDYPFPGFLRGVDVRADWDTPAPALFTSQDSTNWFAIAAAHPEIRVEVDFDPAPRLSQIQQAFNAAQGQAELLVVAFAGTRHNVIDVGLEGLYIPLNSAFETKISMILGEEPNAEMDSFIGWEWFGGWP